MTHKTALVTGGTSGVGLSIVRGLVKSGAHVHFIGSNADKGRRVEQGLSAEADRREGHCTFIQLDLSQLRAVHDFATHFTATVPALDLLVNVAGVVLPTRQETAEGIEKTLAIGYLAPFVLCRELAPLIAEAPHGRIVNVSGTPRFLLKPRLDFDDLQLTRGYTLLRAALNAVHAKTVLTEILAERLASQGVDVNAFHPGRVRSDLLRNLPFPLNRAVGFAQRFSPAECESGIYASCAEELNGVTGQLFVGTSPRKLSFDSDYKARLWSATEQLLAPA